MVSVGSLVLVCYFTIWSQEKIAIKLTPENIDPHLCTHINYVFANVVKDELKRFDSKDNMQHVKLIGLKAQNPKLKILVSVGGI